MRLKYEMKEERVAFNASLQSFPRAKSSFLAASEALKFGSGWVSSDVQNAVKRSGDLTWSVSWFVEVSIVSFVGA